MSVFLARRMFELYLRGVDTSINRFEKGCVYKGTNLKGAERTGMGDTIEEVLLYLEQGGYITILSEGIHGVLKSLLFNKVSR